MVGDAAEEEGVGLGEVFGGVAVQGFVGDDAAVVAAAVCRLVTCAPPANASPTSRLPRFAPSSEDSAGH